MQKGARCFLVFSPAKEVVTMESADFASKKNAGFSSPSTPAVRGRGALLYAHTAAGPRGDSYGTGERFYRTPTRHLLSAVSPYLLSLSCLSLFSFSIAILKIHSLYVPTFLPYVEIWRAKDFCRIGSPVLRILILLLHFAFSLLQDILIFNERPFFLYLDVFRFLLYSQYYEYIFRYIYILSVYSQRYRIFHFIFLREILKSACWKILQFNSIYF